MGRNHDVGLGQRAGAHADDVADFIHAYVFEAELFKEAFHFQTARRLVEWGRWNFREPGLQVERFWLVALHGG